MKKHVILFCEGKQQFGVMVEEMSASKVAKTIVDDLTNSSKEFIELTGYVPDKKDSSQELYVRTSIVVGVLVADINNIQVPNKQLMMPGFKN